MQNANVRNERARFGRRTVIASLAAMTLAFAASTASAEHDASNGSVEHDCSPDRVHEIHEETEHNVGEKVLEKVAPTVEHAHEERIREDCVDKAIHPDPSPSPDHGGGDHEHSRT